MPGRWSSLWDGCRQPPHAAYPQLKRPGPGLAAYLALLRPGVAVPCLLPGTRWALTPPFHPYPLDTRAVCSLWPCSVASRRPGVTWRSALWSSDFPRWTPLADPPRPSAPPLPRQEITGPQGKGARLYLTKRRITRPKLSVAAPSSQNPACSLNAANRNRGHSLGTNVARSGSNPTAESAYTPRSR